MVGREILRDEVEAKDWRFEIEMESVDEHQGRVRICNKIREGDLLND